MLDVLLSEESKEMTEVKCECNGRTSSAVNATETGDSKVLPKVIENQQYRFLFDPPSY